MIKTILGIETSCDETSAAILQKDGNKIKILSHVIASSAEMQNKFGGIIPEQAAREQIKSIIPVIQEAIDASQLTTQDIEAIAVTQGPGLIGSLLVGVETAKTLALVWDKPLIPVNHLIGHFYANWISSDQGSVPPAFPCIGLLVSGGHTDLVLFKDHGEYEYLGGTRDDAAGECFDKSARLLGLPYPGGPAIAQRAMNFQFQISNFQTRLPRPMINENNLDFSFSGLKTAVAREVEILKSNNQFSDEAISQLCYEVQQSITEVLVKKTIAAIKQYDVKQLIVAGGVAANRKLASELELRINASANKNEELSINLHIPPANLCTDNAAMIASAAFFLKPATDPLSIQANPNLSLAY